MLVWTAPTSRVRAVSLPTHTETRPFQIVAMSTRGRQRHAIRSRSAKAANDDPTPNVDDIVDNTNRNPLTAGNQLNLGRGGGNAEDAARRLANKKRARIQVASIFATNPTDVVGLKWKLNHLFRLDAKEQYDVSDSLLMGLEVMRTCRDENRATLIAFAKDWAKTLGPIKHKRPPKAKREMTSSFVIDGPTPPSVNHGDGKTRS